MSESANPFDIDEQYCDLRGCSERFDWMDGDHYEVKTPDDIAFGSRYCSVNCAKIALMRLEKELKAGEDDG